MEVQPAALHCFSPGLKRSTLLAADLGKLASVWHFVCFLQERDLLPKESCPKMRVSVVQKCSSCLLGGVFFLCHSASWGSRSKLKAREIEVGGSFHAFFRLSPIFAFLMLLDALCSFSLRYKFRLGQLKSTREVPRRDALPPVLLASSSPFGQVSAQSPFITLRFGGYSGANDNTWDQESFDRIPPWWDKCMCWAWKMDLSFTDLMSK